MFPSLPLFAKIFLITWFLNFVLKTFQVSGKWSSKADDLSCFHLEEFHHLLLTALETVFVIPETSRILLFWSTTLFHQATIKGPFLHRNKAYWRISNFPRFYRMSNKVDPPEHKMSTTFLKKWCFSKHCTFHIYQQCIFMVSMMWFYALVLFCINTNCCVLR